MTSLFDMPAMTMEPLHGAMVTELIHRVQRGVTLLEFAAVDERIPAVLEETGSRGEEEVAEASAVSERARQIGVMVAAAREDALATARREFEEELETRLGAERARTERVCLEFARDRQQYFGAAETQVVKLALAVASRVLGGEIEGDDLPMRAMVKAALARMRDGSTTVMRVRGTEHAAWEETLAGQDVKVVADERVGAGEVVLETGVGRVELGVACQLAEIERGFGELMRRQGE